MLPVNLAPGFRTKQFEKSREEKIGRYRVRPPRKPITLQELAALCTAGFTGGWKRCPFPELMEGLLQDDVGIEKFTSRIVLRQSSGKRTYPLSLIASPG